MTPQHLLRSLARVLPLLLLSLTIPNAVLSQPTVPGPLGLAPEGRSRLAQAAEDSRLAPWQRDLMLRLARTGTASTLDSSAANLRAARSTIVSGTVDGAWTQTEPSARVNPSAIYDPVRDRMVVFGGWDTRSTSFNDVWALSLAGTPAWTQLSPSGTPPSGQSGYSAIYDPVRDRMMVFGGWNSSALNDVWALSLAGTPAWTQLTPSGTPPTGRDSPTAIYDPVRDRMVVFGGWGYSGSSLNDVWTLSLAGTPAWTELTPPGTPPGGRYGHSAIYDSVRDRMVVFGGYNYDSSSLFNDVWALSLADAPAWTQLTPSGTPPSTRISHSAIYDPVRDRMVVFWGWDYSGSLNDVWALSLAGTPAWTELTPSGTLPGTRDGNSAIYDPVRDRIVAFGGYSGSVLSDVWALSLADTPAWTELTPSGTPPSGRSGHSAIYDPVRDRMVVFGGWGYSGHSGSSGSSFNDVWALSLAGTPARTQLAPSGSPPCGRDGHSAIYDPVRDRMVVFGGWDASCYSLNDVWALSLAGTPAWTQLTPLGTPPSARTYPRAIYDPVRDRMVVFGGYNYDSGSLSDVWALSLADTPAWTQLTPAGTPPSTRISPTAIYDPVRDRIVVFGGYSDSVLNDVRALSLTDPPAWTELTPSGTPPCGREGHSAIYDPVRDRMVVFGGHYFLYTGQPYAPSYYFNDVWALSLADTLAWTGLAPTGMLPNTRAYQSAIYDPRRDHMVVFGGYWHLSPPGVQYSYFNDVWTLEWGDVPTPFLLSLVSANVTTDGVKLTWFMGGSRSSVATVYRSFVGGEWTRIGGEVTADGTGFLRYTDPIDATATRVGYRLGIINAGIEGFYGEAWVDLPTGEAALAFALDPVRPNPTRGGALTVRFTLPTDAPARLELLDVSGRRVVEREVASPGAGHHALDLGQGMHLAPGLYLVRLAQSTNMRVTRVVVLK